MICAPPIDESKASSNQLADWLELEALLTESGTTALAAINQNLEIDEDFEPAELDDENLVADRRAQQALSAIEERTKTIGNAYPYVVNNEGTRLSLKAEITPGGYTYLFCLVVSNAAADGHLSAKGPWSPDLVTARKLFQICATVSAAGFVQGPAFSVGWPRPDSSTFVEKLKQVYDDFGDGIPYGKIPPGAPAKVKDDEIDVIAWKHGHGTKPQMGYFLGQAASGTNWTDKALKGTVDLFHGTWFTKEPASKPRVGTIIPFFLPSDADAADHEDQETIDGELRRHVLRHGEVLFRHRIARFVDDGRALAGVCTVEGAEDLDSVSAFVRAYRQQLQQAASGV
jgi:hypothetical protein